MKMSSAAQNAALAPAYIPLPRPAGAGSKSGAGLLPPPGLDMPAGMTFTMAAAWQPEAHSEDWQRRSLLESKQESQATDLMQGFQNALFLDHSWTSSIGESWPLHEDADLRSRSFTWPPMSPQQCALRRGATDWWGCAPDRGPVAQRRRHRQGERRRRCQLQIATHLNELEQKDPACVFFVRQIGKLGFKSPEILTEHFKQYGPVVKVLVSNSHEKSSTAPFPVRLRPSGMGFVLMERPEDTAAVLAQGELQVVRGVEVRVRAFEQRSSDHAASDEEEDEEDAEKLNLEEAALEEAETTASSASSPRAAA